MATTEKVTIEIVGKDGVTTTFGRAATATDKLKGAVKNVASGFSEFGLAVSGVQKALEYVTQAYDATVGATIEYDDAVRKMSQNLQISTEESSKLIQITDDYGLSVEQTSKALELAAKNGFEPSIENLAKMADELNAIKDPNDRAKEAAKIFGRQWADINPILVEGGENILAMSDALDGALIRSEDQVAASRELDLALDNLNDRWQALKIGIGTQVIPVLIEALKNIDEAKVSMEDMRQTVEDLNLANATYAQVQSASKDALKLYSDEIERANNPMVALAYYQTQVLINEATDVYASYAGTAAFRTADYNASVSDIIPTIDDLYDSQLDVNDAMADFSLKALFAKASANLTEDAAFTLAESMGLIDQRTVFADQRLGFLKKQLDDGKISVETYTALVAGLGDAMAKIEDKSVVITVDTYYNEHYGQTPDRTGGGAAGASGYESNAPRAYGGPVTAGVPYTILEQGRDEVFIPNVSGYVLPADKAAGGSLGGNTNNYNLTINSNAATESVVRDFKLMQTWAKV